MLENTINYYARISDEALKNLRQEKKFQFRKYMTNLSLLRANESYLQNIHNSEKANELIRKYQKDMQNMYKIARDEYNKVLKQIKATKDPALKQALLNQYADSGIIGFVAKNGARWNIETYSRMYTIHVNNQLLRMSVFENARNNLFQVSDHGTQCDLCKPWEGGIYTREELDSSTLFHPNCKHFVTEVRKSEVA